MNTNTTDSTCPELDGSYRSVWSILGSCAVTLLICVWHAVHLGVPEPGEELASTLGLHLGAVITGFLAPEVVIWKAMQEWISAHHTVVEFGEKGYEWSMTHSYFADAGGFVYRSKGGQLKVINALEFLELCEAGKIVNPFITENDIKDRSKSDAVSKAIFTVQLLWFILQITVCHFVGLAVTLVELDTLCMALLAVFYLLLWWNKPLNAGSPHVFDETHEDRVYSPEELSKAWKSQSRFLCRLIMSIARMTEILMIGYYRMIWQTTSAILETEQVRLARRRWSRSYTRVIVRKSMSFLYIYTNRRKDANRGCFLLRMQRMCKLSSATFNKTIKKIDPMKGSIISLCFGWSVLGALHLTAWNYEFSTEKHALMWRGASLALTASGFVSFVASLAWWLLDIKGPARDRSRVDEFLSRLSLLAVLAGYAAVIGRTMLVVLMLLSLRALPCSAHQTIPWVQYIPHL